MLGTIETVADLSYAWHALAGYKEASGGGLNSAAQMCFTVIHAS